MSVGIGISVSLSACVLQIQDAQNAQQVRKALKLVAPLPVVWLTEADCNRALSDFTTYHLSHRLGLLDALIAACAVGLSATLRQSSSQPITGLIESGEAIALKPIFSLQTLQGVSSLLSLELPPNIDVQYIQSAAQQERSKCLKSIKTMFLMKIKIP